LNLFGQTIVLSLSQLPCNFPSDRYPQDGAFDPFFLGPQFHRSRKVQSRRSSGPFIAPIPLTYPSRIRLTPCPRRPILRTIDFLSLSRQSGLQDGYFLSPPSVRQHCFPGGPPNGFPYPLRDLSFPPRFFFFLISQRRHGLRRSPCWFSFC